MGKGARILLAVAAAGVAVGIVARRPRPAPLPNILLVTVDTLRPDHLGAWGYPAGTSPVIDAMAAEGASFLTTIVPRGQTWPTLATLLTGQYPVTHGVRRNGLRLSEGAVTLGHVLGGAGYRCAAALANSGSAEWPGFAETVQDRDNDEAVRDAAIRFLRAHGETVRAARQGGEPPAPFFLWVHLFAPHHPYQPAPELVDRFDPGYAGAMDGSLEQVKDISARRITPAAEDVRHLIARYDGEVRTADGHVGRLLAALEDEGLAAGTIVAFTADHGEELYERNRYLSHSASVYDSVLRAPWILRWPGRIPAGRKIEGLAETGDIAPTLLELAGVRAPESFRGVSRAAAATGRGPGRIPDGPAFSELEDRVVSVRTAEVRYVSNPSDFDFPLDPEDPSARYPIDREELYDLVTDPAERDNRAPRFPNEASGLRDVVAKWQDEHGWSEASVRLRGREAPEDVREALDALGYVR
ncbi:MAG TPA: sulfatase [bacterium]|nr:sulfatase [bacterium]